MVSTPHQGSFSLLQKKTTPENYNQSKFRVVDPSPNRYFHKAVLHLRLRKLCGNLDRKILRARGSEILL